MHQLRGTGLGSGEPQGEKDRLKEVVNVFQLPSSKDGCHGDLHPRMDTSALISFAVVFPEEEG